MTPVPGTTEHHKHAPDGTGLIEHFYDRLLGDPVRCSAEYIRFNQCTVGHLLGGDLGHSFREGYVRLSVYALSG